MRTSQGGSLSVRFVALLSGLCSWSIFLGKVTLDHCIISLSMTLWELKLCSLGSESFTASLQCLLPSSPCSLALDRLQRSLQGPPGSGPSPPAAWSLAFQGRSVCPALACVSPRPTRPTAGSHGLTLPPVVYEHNSLLIRTRVVVVFLLHVIRINHFIVNRKHQQAKGGS